VLSISPFVALAVGWQPSRKKAKTIFFPSHSVPRCRLFTPEAVSTITRLHVEGKSKEEISRQTGIKKNTLDKALSQKRIILPDLDSDSDLLSTMSSRSAWDTNFRMGKSCSNEIDRVLASRYGICSQPVFGNHLDLGYGGLLLALPSLLCCGLLRHVERFSPVSGY
jgi:hypothetical protein